ncbi:cobalt transporter subunit CbtA [Arboricoccus pini]|uniref:Cobalt transporter subunit CbtA n=1 Tax=Arboricoccus pini TaxID=1963835 RepID=A0A212QRS5_9PROT|nr:CbtA family protein [Arboricoccus pini]SNB62243.1 cobalt transporter subunit CbtA [Arboricoccus pini]
MSLFRSIVFTAVLTGIIVGCAASVFQFLGTSQLIAEAEVYENAGQAKEAQVAGSPSPDAHAGQAVRHHNDGEWKPADGFERMAFTLAANVLTAIGYALILCALISLRGKPVTWRQGLLWGLAGFACVMLAPMIGLPPELPGTPSAPLADRQIWWIGTALATATGIGLIAFQRRLWAIVLAGALIVAPHVIGAPPAPEGMHALAPDALEHKFIAAALVTSLLFWVLLGLLSGMIYGRFEHAGQQAT